MKGFSGKFVFVFVLLGACGDSPSESSLSWQGVENESLDIARECECSYADLGYASEQACLDAIAWTAAEKQEIADCLDALLAPASDAVLSDFTCRVEFDHDYKACLYPLGCGPSPERDACYAMYPEETSCPDCVGLSGDALTSCQAEVSAFWNAVEGCF